MGNDYLMYRGADVLSQILPRPVAYWFGMRIAAGMCRRDHKGREAVKANMRHILQFQGMRAAEDVVDGMALQTFQSFGKYLVDFFRYREMTCESVARVVTIEHPEYLDELKSRDMGVVLASGHLGNWELAGGILATMGFCMNAVVLPYGDARTERLFTSRREQRGFRLIPVSNAVEGALRALRRKECVAMLMDRDYSRRKEYTRFMGAPARLPMGAATIAVRTGVPVLQGYLFREADDTFRFRLCRPLFVSRRDSIRDVHEALCENLAAAVAEHPTQWFKFEPMWETQAREIA